jgi:hypothetical protein
MNRYSTMIRSCLTIVIACVAASAYAQVKKMPASSMQFGFVENKGQIVDQHGKANPSVLYTLSLPANTIQLKAAGFSYDTYSGETQEKITKESILKRINERNDRVREPQTLSYHRIDVEFVDANPDVQIVNVDPASDVLLYQLNGREMTIRHYARVIYKNLYPSIDLEFIAKPGTAKPVEYNFIVHPGGDFHQIKLRYQGALSSNLRGGKLNLKLTHGNLIESIPASYWEKSKRKVNISYKELSKKDNHITLGFNGNVRQKNNEALVIDPVVDLDWTYYHTGTGTDYLYHVATDHNGNIYSVGPTDSQSGVATSGSHQNVYGGGATDGFLVKLNKAGVRQWATYYGGGGTDDATGVAVDPQGNVYISGTTNSITGIATSNAYQPSLAGLSDAFVAKFYPSGARRWATYFGTSAGDGGANLSVANDGSIYLVGSSTSTTGLATTGTHQTSSNGNSDVFIAKFTTSGALQWATYYGGEAGDYAQDVAIDSDNSSIFITGQTASENSIATPGAYQETYSLVQSGTAYVAKFNANSGTRAWGTYVGKEFGTYFRSVAADSEGNVIASGYTTQDSLASPGSHSPVYQGGVDGLTIKLTNSGSLLWATYYGGTGTEISYAMAVGSDDAVYLGGLTVGSLTGIATPDAYQTEIGSSHLSGFLAKLDENGVRKWGTYYSDQQSGAFIYGLSIDAQHGVVLCGQAFSETSANGIVIGRFIQNEFNCSPPDMSSLQIQKTSYLCATQFSVMNFNACKSIFTWDFGDGNTKSGRTVMHTYQSPGTYTVSVNVNYRCRPCTGDTTLTQQVTISPVNGQMDSIQVQVETDQRNDVLAATASTFSDTWTLKQLNSNLDNKNSYANGSKGVWRNSASFAYKKSRKLSPTTNLATDGTFVFDRFNWQSAANAIPSWIEATTMTHYSPFSYELENRDVLNVYTAAVYDYGGHLVAANGANMRHDEMAFTSFEFIDGTIGGNWILGTQPIPDYTEYKIRESNSKIAVVEASLEDLTNVTSVDITAYSIHAPTKPIYYQNNEIVCMVEHPDNSDWTLVVLKSAPADVWTGTLRFKNIINPTTLGVTDNTIAHSGKMSLKVTADQIFKQDLLSLTAGKSYWINTWASVNNPTATTPTLAGSPSIEIIAKAKNHQVIQTFVFTPTGALIEGWQQIKGSFTCPAATAYIEIKFDNGTAPTVWFDDLRLQPENGNMKGYVYDLNDYRLKAVLDEENFASFFYYDQEGNLYLTKKETIDGIKTISENISYTKEIEQP